MEQKSDDGMIIEEVYEDKPTPSLQERAQESVDIKIDTVKTETVISVAKKENFSEPKSTMSFWFDSILKTNPIFIVGLLTGITILSLIFNIVLLSKLPVSDSNTGTGVAQAQNQPAAPSPSQAPPTQPANTVQAFNITKDDHVRGDFNAPITLVEFSDFECPYCEKHAPTLQKALDEYKGKVRLVYKHFPLNFHPNGQKAAESAECASEQGKFWEYHDKLFAEQPNGFSVDKFKQWAKDLGLNSDQFNACLDTDKYANKVDADAQEGAQKGVNGTPATFINGQLISGAVPYASFKQAIDLLLK